MAELICPHCHKPIQIHAYFDLNEGPRVWGNATCERCGKDLTLYVGGITDLNPDVPYGHCKTCGQRVYLGRDGKAKWANYSPGDTR